MTGNDLKYLKNWFSNYTKLFYSTNEEDQKNIIVKIEHTNNVCKNIIEIAKGLALSDNQTRIAETVALFHDVGRFSQYTKYKTFRDALSKNHGLLGANVLTEENVFQNLPEDEQELIVQTVKFHNAFAIPGVFNERTVFFLKLIRDADKLDIYRVFIKYYESPDEDKASATAFGLQDTSEYSNEVLLCIKKKKVASYSNLRTENDFKLLKLSWVFALNFNVSLRLLKERGYIDKISQKLPQTDEVISAITELQEYISQRLQNGDTK
jgi:hypothetical protein